MRKHGWRTPEWKLIIALEPDFHFKPEVELYNLKDDPNELKNLAELRSDMVDTLKKKMEAWLAKRKEETGLESPAAMQDLMNITRERGAYVPYSAEDTKLYNDLMSNMSDNMWMLNIVDNVNYVLITNPKMGNVQQSGQAIAADNSGEQMFYE
mgnify:CR=1 FL=1